MDSWQLSTNIGHMVPWNITFCQYTHWWCNIINIPWEAMPTNDNTDYLPGGCGDCLRYIIMFCFRKISILWISVVWPKCHHHLTIPFLTEIVRKCFTYMLVKYFNKSSKYYCNLHNKGIFKQYILFHLRYQQTIHLALFFFNQMFQ